MSTKRNTPLQSILFTHTDLDGGGCRILFELVHSISTKGISWDVRCCSNDGIDREVLDAIETNAIDENTYVFFGDICCSRLSLKNLLCYTTHVYVMDHHRTNLWVDQELPSNQCLVIPENDLGVPQCGTSVVYQHFVEWSICNPLPYSIDKGVLTRSGRHQEFLALFVDTIRAYDTYEWKKTNNLLAKELNTLFYLLGMDRFCNMYIQILRKMDVPNQLIPMECRPFIDAKLEKEDKAISKFGMDDVILVNVRDKVAALLCNTYFANFSELSYQFLKQHPEIDLMIQFSLTEGGKFEFRTQKDDIDLGKDFALPIGGGGHPKAAGASLPDSYVQQLREMILDCLNGTGNTFWV